MMKVVLILVMILCMASGLWADGFGYDGLGMAGTTIEDRIWANISSPTSSGELDSIKVRIDVPVDADPHNVKCAIYKWSDTSFVDSTEIIEVPLGAQWIYFEFIEKASIFADTEYALCVVAEATGGDCLLDVATSGGSHTGQYAFTYGVWPTPNWEAADQSGPYKFSIYCYYTPELAAGHFIMINH